VARTGILLLGYGGPESLEGVEPFLENMMGRPPSAEMLARVHRRYLTIGGGSPLPKIAVDIAKKLHEELGSKGQAVPVAVGMLHWRPYIADSLAGLVAAGCDRIVTVSLSPFESFASSGAYRAAVAKALATMPDVTVAEAPSFRDQEGFLTALMTGCHDALEDLKASTGSAPVAVLFSAHSLPVDKCGDDPYEAELRATALDLAGRLSLPLPVGDGLQSWLPGFGAYGATSADRSWLLTYQSAGQSPGEWLGPDVADVVAALPGAGYGAVAFCPIGFATDHLETLYDLDVEAAGQALDLGLEYARAAVPNDADAMIGALVAVVEPLL
jgi:ferrochelatase